MPLRTGIQQSSALPIPPGDDPYVNELVSALRNELDEIRFNLDQVLRVPTVAKFTAHGLNNETAVTIEQLATGGVAGAHINLNDKAGDPPSPVLGDLWRNGDALMFETSAGTVDLRLGLGAAGDVYKNISDGSNTASASGITDTFKLIAASNKITIVVGEAPDDRATFDVDPSQFGLDDLQSADGNYLITSANELQFRSSSNKIYSGQANQINIAANVLALDAGTSFRSIQSDAGIAAKVDNDISVTSGAKDVVEFTMSLLHTGGARTGASTVADLRLTQASNQAVTGTAEVLGFRVLTSGTGTVDEVVGCHARVNPGSGGDITNFIGFQTTGAGIVSTVGTGYGFRHKGFTSVVDTPYAFYADEDPSYFGDYIDSKAIAAPANPAAGNLRFYPDSGDSNKPKWRDSAGTVYSIPAEDRLVSSASTLILSDDATDQTLTGNLGRLIIRTAASPDKVVIGDPTILSTVPTVATWANLALAGDTANPSTNTMGLMIKTRVTGTPTSGTQTLQGLNAFPIYEGTTAQTGEFGLIAGRYYTRIRGSAGNVTHMTGISAKCQAIGATARTITNAYGFKCEDTESQNNQIITNSYSFLAQGQNVTNAGGTIGTAYNYYGAAHTNTGSGTFTNAYGLFLEKQTVGGTINRSLHCAGEARFVEYVDIAEMSAPGTPASNIGRLYIDSTSNNLTIKKDTGSTVDLESGGGVSITVSDAEVFSDTSPTSYTDLDLSGTIGAKTSIVALAIKSASDMNETAVRRNGDTVDYEATTGDANAYGCQTGHHTGNEPLVLICSTDSAGVVEWITSSAETATINLLWYMN